MDRADVYRATIRYFFAPVADLLYEDETVTEVLINGPDRIYANAAASWRRCRAGSPTTTAMRQRDEATFKLGRRIPRLR